jgi:hypothetical protein
MAYASDSLYHLGRTSRWVGALMGLLNLILIVVLVFDPIDKPNRQTVNAAIAIAFLGVLPGLLMFVLSFPVQRGNIWASAALVGACLWQLPMIILFTRFCGACVGSLMSAYLVVRVILAVPEIRFQFRAARRRKYELQRGFEPLMQPVAPAGAATDIPANTPRPPPKSLKPNTRPLRKSGD